MMEWILNDLSLNNQFSDVDDFVERMTSFLKAKSDNKILEKQLSCSTEIGNIEIFRGVTFSQVVMTMAPRNVRSQILSWASKNGPFWSDERTDNQDDYFEYESIDVTDQGLGECSRRACNDECVNSYSFEGKFSKSPLTVQHGLEEDPLGLYDINNIWGMADLEASAEDAIPQPTCWAEAIDRLKGRFSCLLLSDLVYEQMAPVPVPYSEGNFEGLVERFRILEKYFLGRTDPDVLDKSISELLNTFFKGKKAWFSDSTDDECRRFKNELTFKDLFDGKSKQFPFHGKIKTPQLRIHFEWPIPPERELIQVVYIGPKLTKL